MSNALLSRCVRYAELKPCLNAFVDTRTPGSDKKENFTIIGPGVSENPDQHVHLPEAHGFNIGGARQPPGCLNSQHSHETAEVFVVHSGNWRFMYGVDADDAQVEMGPGDTISIPTQMFRGFENIGDDTGFLFAVLGGDDPGKVTWAPSVFTLAEQYGLVLLEGGKLVDVAAGDTLPENARKQQPPTPEELIALQTPDVEKLKECVVAQDQLIFNPSSSLSALASGGSVQEAGIIVPKQTGDGFAPGPIVGWWPHDFNLRCVKLSTGASVAAHSREEAEVIFLQSGELTIISANPLSTNPASASLTGADQSDAQPNSVTLTPGDTLTLPVGTARQWHNSGSTEAIAYVVRGGDSPAPATPVPSLDN